MNKSEEPGECKAKGQLNSSDNKVHMKTEKQKVKCKYHTERKGCQRNQLIEKEILHSGVRNKGITDWFFSHQ